MLTCGMYDYSGQWAFDVGIPAKSGVGGCIFMVIPNVCGIAVWSPRLDSVGNSVRGVQAAKELVKKLQFHNFEVFSGLNREKIDPSKREFWNKQVEINNLLQAASFDDAKALTQMLNSGLNLYLADYDLRTALHLAACEGHMNAVRFLVENAPANSKEKCINKRDRWGGTPLGEAIHYGHTEIAKFLRESGAKQGNQSHYSKQNNASCSKAECQKDSGMVLFASAENDLFELIRLHASGIDIHHGDYDGRTPLHLAASNGHSKIVKYLLVQCTKRPEAFNPIWLATDRYGNTPSDDAIREGHTVCQELLETAAALNEDMNSVGSGRRRSNFSIEKSPRLNGLKKTQSTNDVLNSNPLPPVEEEKAHDQQRSTKFAMKSLSFSKNGNNASGAGM